MTWTAQTRPVPGQPRAAAKVPWGFRGTGILLGLSLGLALPAGAEPATGSGLRIDAVRTAQTTEQTPWSTRFEIAQALSDPALSAPVGSRLGWQWLGDYRFAPAWGLRATGGMLGQLEQAGSGDVALGTRIGTPRSGTLAVSSGLAPPRNGEWLRATPYLGLGFDSAGVLRNGWGAWGLSADLGLVTRRDDAPGLRLGQPAPNETGWRGLHLSPVLQVGVSYSF